MDAERGSVLARGPERRAAILLELERAEAPVTVETLAGAVGLHHNTVREHLRVLEQEGRVRRSTAPVAGRGRPRAAFESVDNGPVRTPVGTGAVALREHLLRILISRFGAPDDAAWAGARQDAREWGRELAGEMDAAHTPDGVAALVARGLTAMGMEPDARADVVDIASCPFADLAADRPDVVCGLHQSVIDGMLDSAAPAGSTARLLPFAGPRMCRVETLVPSAPVSVA